MGDNVGDVAGMGADLFESYAGSIIAPVALAAFTLTGILGVSALERPEFLVFPFAIAAVGMVASIIGSFTVRSSGSASSHDLARALHMGTNVAMGITIVGTVVLAAVMFGGTHEVDNWWGVAVLVIGGLLVGFGIGKVAEIWTSDHYSPVKKIAAQAETGPATTILGGISAGMVSVAAVILIVVAIAVAYWAGEQMAEGLGIYGIAIAAIGMLATTVVSVDAYGPIADNAGGIAEMAELDPSVRELTHALDSLGNTTAAVAKGFAVGSAAIHRRSLLFKSFEAAMLDEGHILDLNVGDVTVFIGLFIGAMLPFLFAALTIDAVGRAANKMIEEVRRQFREIPGLREATPSPTRPAAWRSPPRLRCARCSYRALSRSLFLSSSALSTSTRSAGSSPVRSSPASRSAIFMANAGGAWDNAKKYIEAGHHGGKGSEPHKAAVVGDTVGDPFKDTAGPSMNILIKVMTIVSLIFASAFPI